MNDPHEMALRGVRDAIARAILGDEVAVDEQLGEITLRIDQRRAAARLERMLDENRGAMLAEPVGLGKTYVALAIARRAESVVIVAPAALQTMWMEALAATGVHAHLVTHEALSHGRRRVAGAQLIIVDEAHRFRTHTTRRYTALAGICRGARVLLLTATPIQNHRDDLATQLALFLGRTAWQLDDDQLAAHVLREADAHVLPLPQIDGPHRVDVVTNDDCLDALVDLPSPIPAADEGVGGALLTYSLLHQWSSSNASVMASLKRRLARLMAMRDALAAGRRITRRELTAWEFADDSMQLAFPELVAPVISDVDVDTTELTDLLERSCTATRAVLDLLRPQTADMERAQALRDLRARHPGERTIAFCHYAETATALFRILSRDSGIAMLTSHGARVAGGRIPRAAVLSQFTPRGDSYDPAPSGSANRIELLIATDLLSEGLNLQEASVVIHLDLPWNPARLEQRVGRIRRLGSRHRTVSVYALAPPASAERLLRIEERLRDKLRFAQQTIGVVGQILPSPLPEFPSTGGPGFAEEMGAARRILRGWLAENSASLARSEPGAAPLGSTTPDAPSHIAAIRTSTNGFIAAVRSSGQFQLVADIGNGIECRAATISTALELTSGIAIEVDAALAGRQLDLIDAWLRHRMATDAVDLRAASAGRARREVLARVARALARAPRHQRATLAPLAAAARSAVTARLGEGAERVLDVLASTPLPDEAWLRSLATFAELNAQPTKHVSAQEESGVVALIQFRIDQPPDDRWLR